MTQTSINRTTTRNIQHIFGLVTIVISSTSKIWDFYLWILLDQMSFSYKIYIYNIHSVTRTYIILLVVIITRNGRTSNIRYRLSHTLLSVVIYVSTTILYLFPLKILFIRDWGFTFRSVYFVTSTNPHPPQQSPRFYHTRVGTPFHLIL